MPDGDDAVEGTGVAADYKENRCLWPDGDTFLYTLQTGSNMITQFGGPVRNAAG